MSKGKKIGGWVATALCAGNMIGSGIFVMPASMAEAAGPISLVAWIVVALAFLALTAVFAELGGAHPVSGGPSAFVLIAFGPTPSLVAAFLYWLCVAIGNAAFLTAFVSYAAVFAPILHEPLWAFGCAQVLLWTLVAVNALGVKNAGAVQLVTTVLKVLPLVLLALALLPHANTENLAPLAPKGNMAILPAISLCAWLFLGSESVTAAGEEIEGGGRAIRRASYFGFALATAVYLAVALTVSLALPTSSLVGNPAPLALAARLALGPVGETIITIGALISIIGVLNGWLLVAARAPLAAARAGAAPAFLARLHPTTGTPVTALLVTSAITGALVSLYFVQALLDAYNSIALLATATSLASIGMACVALVVLARKAPAGVFGRNAQLIGVGGLLVVILMIAGSGRDVILLTAAAALVPAVWGFVGQRARGRIDRTGA